MRSRPETASGFANSMGAIKFDLNGRHSSLTHIAWNQNGMLYTFLSPGLIGCRHPIK